MEKFLIFLILVLPTLIDKLIALFLKKQLLLLGFLGMAIGLQAQSFSVGLKAGGQYTDYTKTDDAQGALLYHGGVFAAYSLSDKFAVQLEALYSLQGENGKEDATFEERATYINAPLMLKYRMAPRLQVVAGGQIGLLMKAKLQFDDSDDPEDNIDRKHKYESTALAALAGVEYQITDRLTFGLRASLGLGSFHKQLTDSRQNAYQASVAYRLFSL